MNIVILGPPGSGKGTQSKILTEKFGFKHLIMSDILRNEMKESSEYSKIIESTIKKGDLLNNDIIFDIFKKHIKSSSINNSNFIFDGIPRTLKQAQFLDKILSELKKEIDLVINFQINDQILFSRIQNRVVCEKCSDSFLKNQNDKCPVCGEKLICRIDDNLDIADHRLQIYNKVNSCIQDYYKKNNTCDFLNINADRNIKEISREISRKVDCSINNI